MLALRRRTTMAGLKDVVSGGNAPTPETSVMRTNPP